MGDKLPVSKFTLVPFIAERSEATPGLWNNIISVLSANMDEINYGQVSAHTDTNYISGDNTTAGLVQIYSQLASNASGRDLVLLANGSGDVHVGAIKQGTGVFFVDLNVKVSDGAASGVSRNHGMQITQQDNSVTMEFPYAGGIIEVPARLRGGNSAASNIALRIGSTSGAFVVEDFAGALQLVNLANNGLLTLLNRIRSIDGSLGNAMYSYTADPNIGFYRSGVSTTGVSGFFALGAGSATTPAINFSSESSLGLYRSGASYIGTSYGAFAVQAGAATLPGLAFSSESSLGLYRSGVSTIALSYGTFYIPSGRMKIANGQLLSFGDGGNANGVNIGTVGASNDAFINQVNANNLDLMTSNATRLRIDSNGIVTCYGGIAIKAGVNQSCGTAILGSNGSVNVANTYVAAGDLIFLTDQTPGGTLGDLELGGIRAGSGFTIQSTSLTDTSTVAWLIVRPG